MGADVFGCDAEYRCQQEGVVGDCGTGGGEHAPEDEAVARERTHEDEVEFIEFDAEEDLVIENEI